MTLDSGNKDFRQSSREVFAFDSEHIAGASEFDVWSDYQPIGSNAVDYVDMWDNVVPFPRSKQFAPDSEAARRAEAERFLTLLDPTATYFTFQTFDDDIERKKKRAEDHAKKNKLRRQQGK